jgi:hypothetical protein
MARKYLAVLLVSAILAASILGSACAPRKVQAATATWLEGEKAVKLENRQGVSVKVKGLETEEFEALSAAGEAKVEIVFEPKPGDAVVVLLNRKCGPEELLILSQYIELRDYEADLYALPKGILDAFIALFSALFGGFIPPVGALLPSKGIAYGVLQADADKAETLPFVESMRGCKASTEALEVIKTPFSSAQKELAGEKEVLPLGEFEFEVFTLSPSHTNIQVQSSAGVPQALIWQGVTYQVQEIEQEALVGGEKQFVVRTADNQFLKLYHVEGEEEWTLKELKSSSP